MANFPTHVFTTQNGSIMTYFASDGTVAFRLDRTDREHGGAPDLENLDSKLVRRYNAPPGLVHWSEHPNGLHTRAWTEDGEAWLLTWKEARRCPELDLASLELLEAEEAARLAEQEAAEMAKLKAEKEAREKAIADQKAALEAAEADVEEAATRIQSKAGQVGQARKKAKAALEQARAS